VRRQWKLPEPNLNTATPEAQNLVARRFPQWLDRLLRDGGSAMK